MRLAARSPAVLVGAALCLLPLAWAAALLAHHLVFYGLARTATRAWLVTRSSFHTQPAIAQNAASAYTTLTISSSKPNWDAGAGCKSTAELVYESNSICYVPLNQPCHKPI